MWSQHRSVESAVFWSQQLVKPWLILKPQTFTVSAGVLHATNHQRNKCLRNVLYQPCTNTLQMLFQVSLCRNQNGFH